MATDTRTLEASVVEQQVLDIVRELLVEMGKHEAARQVSLNSSFERDLGLGSLDHVELLIRCEARFEMELPEELAQQAETPQGWVRAVLEGAKPAVTKGAYRVIAPRGEAPPPPHSADTLIQVLRHHTEIEPDRVHVHLLENGSGQDVTYGQLFENASGLAAGLTASGLKPNDTVAIMLPTGADFFYAFFGVMLAGGTPVPVYPPARAEGIEEYVRQQVGILRNADIRFLITFDRVKQVSQLISFHVPNPVQVTTVSALRELRARRVPREPAEIAVLQYTSGSTGDPKGVILQHSNILANLRGIGHAVNVRPTDSVVSWLPLYSDMGLIGSWLFSLYYATPLTLMSPLEFLSRPESWLWAIHDSQATLSAAPNFAYELCARKIPLWTLEGLNLRTWRVAVNAGELVLPETVSHFAARFAPFGFRPESLLPCYGLAESSVGLTFPPLDRIPLLDTIERKALETKGRAAPAHGRDTLSFFSVGRPLPGHEVRIVDEQNRTVGDREQGRLLFRGDSKTPGYFRNREVTAGVVYAEGWMDSGDLAYWADSELYITGRRKDSIIRAGRNISPQDVEDAACEVPGVERRSVAAFGVLDRDTGTERLIVAAETRATVRDDLARIEAAVLSNVVRALGFPPDKIELVRPGSLPKTCNGKIRRSEARALFLAGRLQSGKSPVRMQIARLWAAGIRPWLGSAIYGVGRRLARVPNSAAVFIVSASAGVAARLARGHQAGRIVQRAAALVLRFTAANRCRPPRAGDDVGSSPSVFVANRLSVLDALVLAAALPAPIVFADEAVFAGLPASVVFLLRAVVVKPVEGQAAPPGGTLQQRIRQALGSGNSVVVFPDAPLGAPPQLCRFRLEALHAAIATTTPVRPVALRNRGTVLIGDGIAVQKMEAKPEASELREHARRALARLCG